MCLIISKEKGIDLPKDKYVKAGAQRNSDGIGVCYLKDGTEDISLKKDFKDVNKFIKWMKNNIEKKDVMVLHFRLATSGLKDEGNRHPFPVTNKKEDLRKIELNNLKYAVAHNGVMYNYSGHKTFNDTQKFVLDILSDEHIKENLKDPTIQKLLTTYISGDRLAILTFKGEIIRIGDWTEDNGLYYSNQRFKPIYSSRNCYGYNGRYWGGSLKNRKFCKRCRKYKKEKNFKYTLWKGRKNSLCFDCAAEIRENDDKEYCKFCGKYSKDLKDFGNSFRICEDCEKDIFNFKK